MVRQKKPIVLLEEPNGPDVKWAGRAALTAQAGPEFQQPGEREPSLTLVTLGLTIKFSRGHFFFNFHTNGGGEDVIA